MQTWVCFYQLQLQHCNIMVCTSCHLALCFIITCPALHCVVTFCFVRIKMGAQAGLQNLCLPASRAVGKWRENEKMKRKWRENEEMERKWREIHSLHFLIFSLFPPCLSISYVKKWENDSGWNSQRERSASCEGLQPIIHILWRVVSWNSWFHFKQEAVWMLGILMI